MAIRQFQLDSDPDYQSISGEGITLRFRAGALQTLRSLVRRGAEDLHRRGFEAGGLLLGSQTSDIRIEAVDAVTIDHRFGPSQQLSDTDVDFYLGTIAEMRQSSELDIIGHFRSHSRGEPTITAADLAIALLIGGRQPLVLLVKSSQMEPSLARLYRRSGEEFAEELAFSLGDAINQLPAAPPLATPVQQTVAPVPVRPIQPDPPAPPPAMRPNLAVLRGTRKAYLLIGLLAFAAIALYFVSRKTFVSPKTQRLSSPAQADLGLSVKPDGGELAVTWNWSSTEIHNAISGELTIQDGADQRKLHLTPEALRFSNVFYAPQTGSVQVRLEVLHENGRFNGETVTVDTGLRKPAAEATAQPPTEDARVAPPPKPVRVLRARPTHVPARPVSPRTQDTKKEEKRKRGVPMAEAVRARLREFRPPAPSRPAMGGVQSDPPAPGIAPVAGLTPSARSGLFPVVRPSPMPSSPPPVSYVAAVSIRKTNPVISDSLRSMIPDRLSVEVKVKIDSEGKVTDATPINMTSSTQNLIGPSAAQAAMLWRFAPARRNGQAVESELVLRFDFERQGR